MPMVDLGSVYEFLDFRLDCGRFELARNGHPVRMERKPLELLMLLASREGQLVTREEIARHLWSTEVFVDTEHGINTAIRKIRTALKDDPEAPRFVQTVTGMGYRFIAPVSEVAPATPASPDPVSATMPPPKRRSVGWYVAAAGCIVLAVAGALVYRREHRSSAVRYTQLTDFTDSAAAPALSPDGHLLAFIRGDSGFLTSDQIYVKMLPDGEPKRVTDDDRLKYGLAFSPDGSEIAYTVLDSSGFSTYEVSALGGEPHLLLNNAAGLVWLNPQHLLFSQIESGIHMGVVTATVSMEDLRKIYFPAHERGMAHYSFPSRDRQWAVVVEMNANGGWAQCKLIALGGRNAVRPVGPVGACTSAGWSADGTWMYFTVTMEGRSHIWRQHFPDGEPEQITFGPTEESGIAVEPNGEALITSVGVHESALWIHEPSGDRPLSSEGQVVDWPSPPAFSPDGSTLYYLLRRSDESHAELWTTNVESGKSEPVFSGISIVDFSLSPDGKQAVYTTAEKSGKTQLWIAPLDRGLPANKVNISGAQRPHFGSRGQILFQKAEGNLNYLEQVKADGANSSKVLPYPIEEFQGTSPSGRWVTVAVPSTRAKDLPAIMLVPLDAGVSQRICATFCVPSWSSDGRFLVVPVEDSSGAGPGRSLAIPVGEGESLPDLPQGGIPSLAEPSILKGADSIGRAEIVPAKDPERYAWVKTTVQRNLYRISLR
jgi:DNA-binding winged helix-turn-helix (wHTH) protein/Tol biopolymer transport system component